MLAGEKEAGNFLISQVEAKVESIEAAVNKLGSDVYAESADAIEQGKDEPFKARERSLGERLNVGLQNLVMKCLPLIEDDEAVLKNSRHTQFMSQQRSKLAEISSQIAEKTEKKGLPSSGSVEKSNRVSNLPEEDRSS